MAAAPSYPTLIWEQVREPLDRLGSVAFYIVLVIAAEIVASGGSLLAKGEYHNAALVFASLGAWAALSYGLPHLVDRLQRKQGITAAEGRSILLFGLYAYPVTVALGYAARTLHNAGVSGSAVGVIVIVTLLWPPTLYYGLETEWFQRKIGRVA